MDGTCGALDGGHAPTHKGVYGHGGEDGGGGGEEVGVPPDGGGGRHQCHLWHRLREAREGEGKGRLLLTLRADNVVCSSVV